MPMEKKTELLVDILPNHGFNCSALWHLDPWLGGIFTKSPGFLLGFPQELSCN